MAFKVFLSHGPDPNEQVAALRLQTLATAYGMYVSVPHRNGQGKSLPAQVRRAIDHSDCVLVILIGGIGPSVSEELNYALSKRKLIVPVVREGISLPRPLDKLPLFHFSPWDAGKAETKIVEFLARQKLSPENLQSMAAFVQAGLGVFALAALAEK